MTTEFREYDPANYLETQADMAEFLNAALELDDPRAFKEALGAVARTRHERDIERGGSFQGNPYRSLSEEENPRFTTLSNVLDALGVAPKRTA